uniref:Uncharacterized protein n=1 Tax=Brassica oleracea TaxID=3712 RepID=A0A3P6DRF8_BRAOL|nr:unnamed protein product [Brassica oleracea]
METHHGGRRSRSSRRLLGLRRQRNDGNSPQRATLPVLTASPRSSLVFAVRGTMETHHGRSLCLSSGRLLRRKSKRPVMMITPLYLYNPRPWRSSSSSVVIPFS